MLQNVLLSRKIVAVEIPPLTEKLHRFAAYCALDSIIWIPIFNKLRPAAMLELIPVLDCSSSQFGSAKLRTAHWIGHGVSKILDW